MQFVDLGRQLEEIRDEVDGRIKRVLDHGQFIMGPEVGEFESKLARFVGVKHCISCANGTDALQMALMALGVGPGKAVFTTTFTFIATSEVISLLGATPIFVDIDPRTFNLDPDALARSIEEVRRQGDLIPSVVIPVDLFGLTADYDVLEKVCAEFGLSILEDAAQSMGAENRGRKAGAFGRLAATSFFPAKPLGCFGDGGAVFTNDDQLASVIQSIRIHGKGHDKYDNVRIGLNSRLDTIQAAILLAKLEIFPDELKARQKVAEGYEAALQDVVATPYVPQNMRSAWAQYSVLAESREELQASLREKGVPTNVYYPRPLHLQTAYSTLNLAPGSFPVAEQTAEKIFSLPMHPYLTEQEQREVTLAVAESREKIGR